MYFSNASSDVGSPGSAQGSNITYESYGILKLKSNSVPPTFYIVTTIFLGFILLLRGKYPKFQIYFLSYSNKTLDSF